MKNKQSIAAIGVMTLALASAGAQAGLYESVARGLFLVDARIVNVDRDFVGNGYSINAFANYNDRTFSVGVADLTLNGQIQATAGYTLRGIPKVSYSMTTGAPLDYRFSVVGSRDLTTNGSLLVNVDSQINLLGFYDHQVQISNRVDQDFGAIANEQLGYDIGPIDVSGNVWGDILVMVTQPFFDAADVQNPLAVLSGRATRVAGLIETIEDLSGQIAAGASLTDAQMGELISSTVAAKILDPNAAERMPTFASLDFDTLAEQMGTPGQSSLVPIPEPMTMWLLLVGGGLLFTKRR